MDNPSTLNNGKDREKYGRDVAIVMALKKDNIPPSPVQALPVDTESIRQRLQVLSQKMTSNLLNHRT